MRTLLTGDQVLAPASKGWTTARDDPAAAAILAVSSAHMATNTPMWFEPFAIPTGGLPRARRGS